MRVILHTHTHTHTVKLSSNTETSGRYHSSWLCMMYPRLKLARNLLRDDGIIFINIDDNEVENLNKICDEIFGEENFVAKLVWTNKEGGGSSDSKLFKIKHEYILVYSKNISLIEIKGIPVHDVERYSGKDEYFETRGPFQLIKLDSASLTYSDSLNYPLECPDGTFVYPSNSKETKSIWRWSPKKVKWGIENGYVEFKKKNNIWNVYTKQYLNADNEGNIISRTNRPVGIIDQYSSTKSSKYLQQLFGNKIFDYSKPYELIKYLMELSITENSIILDFFSGSSTTAESLLGFNNENSTKNNFIMVQLPEFIKENSNAYKEGYKNICEIGKERIRRAGDKIVQESGNKNLDIGFKVFKLDSSNLEKWDPDYDNLEQSLLVSQDNIKPDRTQEDLIYEIMLKYGIDLTLPIEEYDAGENKIYSIGFGALLICLDNKITKEISQSIIELASKDVSRVVFKDNGFASDADKTNIKETLRSNNIDEFITI